MTPELDPVVLEAMKIINRRIDHNDVFISAGVEKDTLASALIALHDADILMDGEAMDGWALAYGWAGKNPGHLAKHVESIIAGRRPGAVEHSALITLAIFGCERELASRAESSLADHATKPMLRSLRQRVVRRRTLDKVGWGVSRL